MEKVRLLCLPYAGGSAASIYLPWKKKLDRNIEVIPLELAGRGKRIRESLLYSVEDTVSDLLEKQLGMLEEGIPYNIFGHSMGGLLAFELCRKINERGLPLPENLLISAFQPPDVKLEGDIHLLPMEAFAEKMRLAGNIPESIFIDKDLYKVFMPILYADYKMVFEYVYKPIKDRMKVDLHLFTGTTDFRVYQLRKDWARQTKGLFKDYIFNGGHFFIRESEKAVLNQLESILLTDKLILNKI
ncbi:thioesterase II family protein [Bacillus infantis]|uniref:thioesterase II family protein n=1 Tax=Bacillus infantis TaxID=324767 RepID=UPI0016534326|nr:alpha/beta fold hydrolase [Bacillus infantis]